MDGARLTLETSIQSTKLSALSVAVARLIE